MGNKRIIDGLKRFLALCLSASMIFADVLPASAAGGSGTTTVSGTDITEEELKEALAQETDIYPDGGFEFLESQLSAEEGGTKQLIIVRRGGTGQEATVDFKAVDVSATYGEDYLLTVHESDYLSKTLDGEGKPLSDFNTELEILEDGETADTEPESEETFQTVSSSGTVEKKASKSVLQTARDTYLGEDSSSLNWQEMDEAQKVEAEAQSVAYQKEYDEFADGIQGISYTFTFQPGEYMKTVDIETLDDDLSESDEQVMFLLSNASAGEIAGTYTAYLNITDNDEDEKVIFAMDAGGITVDRSEGKATIVVNRVSGVNKIASVIVGTGSDTAVSGVDYEAVKKEVLFTQGVTSQTVEIPLFNYAGAPETAQFQVALDAESSFVQEGCAITTVTLTNNEPIAEETEAAAAEEVSLEEDARLSADANAWKQEMSLKASAEVKQTKAAKSKQIVVKENLDLSTADSIEITWKSNEGSYTYEYTTGSGCSKETKKITAKGRNTYLYVNDSQLAEHTDAFNEKTETFKLKESQKTTNASIKLLVETTGENINATARVTKIAINYPGYQFRVDNTEFEEEYTEEVSDVKDSCSKSSARAASTARAASLCGSDDSDDSNGSGGSESIKSTYSNYYVEKIYTDDESATLVDDYGHRYKNGQRIQIGQIQVAKNGSNVYESAVTLHRSTDTITFRTNYSPNATSNNVKVKEGYNGNVYLAGYQLQKPGGKGWSPLIAPEDFKFGKDFITNYKDYLDSDNTFVVRAVYRPFQATVMFQNGDTSKGSYANGFKKDEVLRCTTLDTIEVRGIAAKGYSVAGFNLGVYSDTNVHTVENTPNKLSAAANEYYRTKDATLVSQTKKKSGSEYQKVNVDTAVVNAAIGNVVTFTPTGEFTYISPVYSVPSVTVKIDPQNNYKDKGAVVYSPGDITLDEMETETETESKVLVGDADHPMVISGVTLNQEYTINAVAGKNAEEESEESAEEKPEEKYKAYFKNFTGDANQDGIITTEEEKAVASYKFVRAASYGNTYTFRPVLDLTLIYYGFVPMVENRYAGIIDGVVALNDKPIFGNKTTLTAVNGAQISVAGETTVTRKDEHLGGVNENGGDGYFSLSSYDFVSGENQTVNISYNNLYLTASQAVNAAAIYKLDAYDTIGVSRADAYLVENEGGKEKVTKINPNDISNGDKTYRISIQTYSKNDTAAATKAIYRFYRQDGSLLGDATQEITSKNGIFTLDFNPASMNIPTGASMSVQFVDQKGVEYFEHDMGFSFKESLGILSFLSSFNFGGAEKAIELIGTIDSAFNFGWDGDIDKIATNSDESSKTISIGYRFSKDKNLTKEDEEKKQAVKDAAKNAEQPTEENKQAVKEAADNVLDKSDSGAKQTTEVAASASIELSFGLEINICRSDKEGHKDKWYFKDMMLTASAEGGVDATITYVTPIGIPIRVGISAGSSGSATMIIDQNYSKDEYYFSQITDKDAAKIDIFDFNMKKSDRAFDAYGMFNIAPYLDLSAGVGFDFLNVMVGGRADFDMNFYTRTDQTNTGNVTFSAYIKMKIIFFTKKWDLAKTTVNMFGGSSSLEELSGGADYTYESLSTMEVDDRAYLKNRSAWQGETSVKTRSVASTSGISEKLLQKGMNPYPDIQMLALSNGKYLAVFLNDNPEEDVYNSTHVYYTVGDGDTWTAPTVIEADGTTDDAPAIFDLGNKGIYVAWSSSNRKLTESDTVIGSLNSMDIHGAFFDRETEKFGDIQEVTETAPYSYQDGDGMWISDDTADVNPHISYDEQTNRMLMFYTKIEYESTAEDDEGLVGDVAKPYSVIAYRVYDFQANNGSGRWIETYDVRDGVSNDYEKAWYGQRFLNLAPLATAEEELDEYGYWAKRPDFKPYQKATYTGEDGATYEQEPIVIESESATYNGLGLYAYVLDYDGNQETENDRDIFLQIYNYEENTFTHPIMITTTQNIPESSIAFGRSGGTTLLTYVAENTLYALNLSYIVKNRLIKTLVDGKELYYIDKTAPTENEGEDGHVYMPPFIVAGEKLSETTGGVSVEEDTDNTETEEESTPEEQNVIVDYRIASTDDYVYAVWTQQNTKAKEGIDENSEEAQNAENRVLESQIYVSRYDSQNAVLTSPVQVTDEEGANYGSIGCAVTEKGQVVMLASKTGSTVETVTGTDSSGKEMTQEVVAPDTDNTSLMALTFTPVSSLTVKDVSIEELMAGTDSEVGLTFYNDGVETLSGLTLTAKDENGEVIYAGALDGGEELYGGRTLYASFPVTLDEDASGVSFTYEVKDENDKVLVSDSYSQEIPLELDVTSFTASTNERGTIIFVTEVTNNSKRKSGEQKVTVSRKIDGAEENYKEISSYTTKNLLPGESELHMINYNYGSYQNMFKTVVTDDGEWAAVTHFKASTDVYGEPAETSVEMKATKEQKLRMSAIQNITVLDGSYAEIGKTYQMEEGDITQLNTTVESSPYDGSRYEGNDADDYDTTNTAGLKVMYTTDNPDVLTVYDSGYVEAAKSGTATVTAYVMPSNNGFIGSEENGTQVEDNYATLPKEAIKSESFQVTVKEKENIDKPDTPSTPDKPETPGTSGTPETPETPGTSPAPAETISVGKTYTVNKAQYKVTKLASGNAAGAVTLVKGKKAKKLTVPASVKLGGKTYAVTAIGTGAFKGYRTATQVVIGKNVKKIAAKAFYGCKKLKKIVIRSKKLSSVGKKAIYGISTKAVIKVPKAKLKAYKKKFSSKTGFKKTMRIRK